MFLVFFCSDIHLFKRKLRFMPQTNKLLSRWEANTHNVSSKLVPYGNCNARPNPSVTEWLFPSLLPMAYSSPVTAQHTVLPRSRERQQSRGRAWSISLMRSS